MADDKVLAELLQEQNLPVSLMTQSRSQAVQVRYETYTQAAIDAGVFGAPSYVVDGELFWGQDRLDFVERALAR
jgi:carboxymethylenebutenolidase